VRQENNVVVVGLGEVGRPLLECLSEHYNVIGIDVAPPAGPVGKVDVLHVCYPFAIKDFVGETARYIELFRPPLTIINSTVGVGTTRTIAERTGVAVVHSPVRGKHVRMKQELRTYTKFVEVLIAPAASPLRAFRVCGLQDKDFVSSGSNRTGEADRDDLLWPADCLGAGA